MGGFPRRTKAAKSAPISWPFTFQTADIYCRNGNIDYIRFAPGEEPQVLMGTSVSAKATIAPHAQASSMMTTTPAKRSSANTRAT